MAKGRRRGPKRSRRPKRSLQSNLQRIRGGVVKRSRLPKDPPSRSLFGQKSGTVEVKILYYSKQLKVTDYNYGTPINSATITAGVWGGSPISSDDIKSMIAQQLLGLKADDLSKGSMQYSINSISVWACKEATSLKVSYTIAHSLFSALTVQDTAGTNHRAAVKMALPMSYWMKDDITPTSVFAVVVDQPAPPDDKTFEVATVRISVRYNVVAVASL